MVQHGAKCWKPTACRVGCAGLPVPHPSHLLAAGEQAQREAPASNERPQTRDSHMLPQNKKPEEATTIQLDVCPVVRLGRKRWEEGRTSDDLLGPLTTSEDLRSRARAASMMSSAAFRNSAASSFRRLRNSCGRGGERQGKGRRYGETIGDPVPSQKVLFLHSLLFLHLPGSRQHLLPFNLLLLLSPHKSPLPNPSLALPFALFVLRSNALKAWRGLSRFGHPTAAGGVGPAAAVGPPAWPA